MESTTRHSFRLLRELWETLRWRYVAFVTATVVFALTMLLPPELFRYFTEGGQRLSQVNAQAFLIQLAIFGGLVATALLVSSFLSTLCQEWLRLHLEAELRRKVLARLHDIPLTKLDGVQRGDWLTRMTGDLGQTEHFLTEALPGHIRQTAILVGSGVLFFLYSGKLALLPMITALALAVFNARVQQWLAPVLGELRFLHGGVFQILIESLEGIRTIRSHSGEPYIQRRFETKLNEITSKSMKVVKVLGALLGTTEFAGQLMVTGCLTAAVWFIVRGQLTLSDTLVYPFFIGMFFNSAQSLASGAYDWNRFFIEGGRLAHLLYDGEGHVSHLGGLSRVTSSGYHGLKVRDLSVGYSGKTLAGPLDMEVGRGELWAIMGPSGCGKSTLLEVLAGLRSAQSGEAMFRNAEGVEVWRSAGVANGLKLPIGPCAYVEQHPYIFEGTLRENLTFGNPERLSDAVIWEEIERAGLYRFVTKYGGLDHFLHDRGRNLSEGERYRIALCRALLLRRPFLLLDEPFAALDEASIELVVATLNEQKKQSGVVVVTHYLPERLIVDGGISFEKLRGKHEEHSVANVSESEGATVRTSSPGSRALAASTNIN